MGTHWGHFKDALGTLLGRIEDAVFSLVCISIDVLHAARLSSFEAGFGRFRGVGVVEGGLSF